MKKFIALLLTLLLALSAAAPALAEKQTYRSLYSGEVTTLNYLTTTTTSEFGLLSNLIDTLVESDRYGQLQPCLAESWEASADGLTWTFRLRQGVQWVDAQGNAVAEVTAHDFVTAAEYILNAQHASGAAPKRCIRSSWARRNTTMAPLPPRRGSSPLTRPNGIPWV